MQLDVNVVLKQNMSLKVKSIEINKGWLQQDTHKSMVKIMMLLLL